jgi:ATP-binding protein involved in chromosome partitioning
MTHDSSALAPVHEADVRRVLEGVIDPELKGNIVELGMVRGIDIAEDGAVTVSVALTISGCPLRTEIRDDVVARVCALPGVTSCRVEFGEMSSDEKSALMARVRWRARDDAPDTEVPLTTKVIAVASGKGGVGKSSVTANLAAALAAQGRTVGVLDADIGGFSIPRMLGMADRLSGTEGKIVPNELVVPAGPDRPGLLKVVSMGFLVEDESSALMWRGLLLAKGFEQFLTDVRWGPMDYLLIDMPPGTGDIQMALGRLLPRAEVVLVTTPARAAQRVAARAADIARKSYLRILGVIENMSAFTCEHGTTYSLFGSGGGGALAAELGVPLVGEIPLEPAVSAGGDAGQPVVTTAPASAAGREFQRIAAEIVAELSPPVDEAAMAGCTARMFDAIEARFAAIDAAAGAE